MQFRGRSIRNSNGPKRVDKRQEFTVWPLYKSNIFINPEVCVTYLILKVHGKTNQKAK